MEEIEEYSEMKRRAMILMSQCFIFFVAFKTLEPGDLVCINELSLLAFLGSIISFTKWKLEHCEG